MKFLFVLIVLTPMFGMAQNREKEPAEKLGPHHLYIIDSVRITARQFQDFDPNTIASLTIFTDTDATKRFGPDAHDGVVVIETKDYAKRHYINFFKRKSASYDSLYKITKSDSTFQYIINDKIKDKNFEGDLARIDDWLFISLNILTADELKKRYNITNKKIGILIECKRPQDVFNWESKF